MIKYFFVQWCIVAIPIFSSLCVFTSNSRLVNTISFRWFTGLFLLIIVLTAVISLGIGLDTLFSNTNFWIKSIEQGEITNFSVFDLLGITLAAIYLKAISNGAKFFFKNFIFSHRDLVKLGAVSILLVYGFSEVILTPVNEWDAVVIWFNKAKSIYYGYSWNKIPFPEYPNSGPIIWALLMRLFGQTEQLGRLLFPTIYVFCCFQFSYFNFCSNRRFIIFITFWLFLSFHFFTSWAWTGYQDNFIACTSAMAVYIFIGRLNNVRLSDINSPFKDSEALAFFFCGMLYLIKNEGLILGVIICSAYLWCFYEKRILKWLDVKKMLFSLLFFFIPVFLQIAIKLIHGINLLDVQGDAFSLTATFSIQERATRIGLIVSTFIAYFKLNFVIYFLSIFSIFCSFFYYRKIGQNFLINKFLMITIFLHCSFIILVFVMTNQHLEWHLSTAYNRLMSQHQMIIFALILWNCAFLINNFRRTNP